MKPNRAKSGVRLSEHGTQSAITRTGEQLGGITIPRSSSRLFGHRETNKRQKRARPVEHGTAGRAAITPAARHIK